VIPLLKMADKNLGAPFLLLPTAHCLLGRGAARKCKKRKRGGKILNLISFELEAVGGKLVLISYLF
jgi:hypothetical protein